MFNIYCRLALSKIWPINSLNWFSPLFIHTFSASTFWSRGSVLVSVPIHKGLLWLSFSCIFWGGGGIQMKAEKSWHAWLDCHWPTRARERFTGLTLPAHPMGRGEVGEGLSLGEDGERTSALFYLSYAQTQIFSMSYIV